MADRYSAARRDVWTHARKMWESGLAVGSAGNVSLRIDHDLIAITPTSIPYDAMTIDDIVVVEMETSAAVESTHKPSYELPMHQSIYRSRGDVRAIVHTHAPYITTLSVLRRPLPPVVDEMVVLFGGAIDVAEYAFSGTEQIATNAVRALHDRAGVILANHGNVCVGRDLGHALHVALAMEAAARVYVQALAIGDPVALPEPSIVAGRRMYEERR